MTPDCAGRDQDAWPRLDLELNMPNGYRRLSADVVAARSLDGLAIPVPNLTGPPLEDLGAVQGGINLPGTLSQDQGPVQVSDASISGLLTINGQAAPTPLEISIAGSTVSLALPDVDATATFVVDLSYHDDCFIYEAAVRGTAVIGSTATVAACPSADGLLPYIRSIAKPISVGGSATEFIVGSFEPRWSSGASATDGPPLAAWDRAIPPIRTSVGTALRIVSGALDVTIDGVSVETFRRADVIRDNVNAERIASAYVAPGADGRVEFHAPATAGRYVVLLFYSWSSACVTGEAFSAVAVDVR